MGLSVIALYFVLTEYLYRKELKLPQKLEKINKYKMFASDLAKPRIHNL